MTPKSFILSVPPKLGETSQFLQSLQTQRLLPSFLYLPLNVSGPHPSAVGFSLLWSPGAAHKGRSEKTGGGVCRLGEGGGCDPSSIQEGPEIIKSGHLKLIYIIIKTWQDSQIYRIQWNMHLSLLFFF